MAKMKIQVPIKPEPLQDPPAPMNDPIPEATKEPPSKTNEHSLCLGCKYAFVVRSERGDDIETEVHCTHPVFEHPHHMMDVVECDGFVQGSFNPEVEKALTPEQKLLEKELSDLEEEGKALNSDDSEKKEGEDDDDEEGEGDEDPKPSKGQLSLDDLDDKDQAKDPKEVKKAMGDKEEEEEESEEDEEEAEEEDDKPQGPVPPGGSQDDE